MSVPLATTPAEQPLAVSAKLRLTGEILATYTRVRWLLARNDLPETVARLRVEGGSPASPASMPSFNRWRLATAIIRVLQPLPTDSRCLMRSLVMLKMLHRRGVPVTLVIGVKTEPEFLAHAWVEEEGSPLLPPGDEDVRPLTTL